MNYSGGARLTKLRPTESSLRYSQHSAEAQGVTRNGEFRIAVIGVGRAGNNTVTKLMESNSTAMKCIAVNTDSSAPPIFQSTPENPNRSETYEGTRGSS